jgi:hypothetical protein
MLQREIERERIAINQRMYSVSWRASIQYTRWRAQKRTCLRNIHENISREQASTRRIFQVLTGLCANATGLLQSHRKEFFVLYV